MTTVSTNLTPKLIMEEVASDGSATATPAADYRAFFVGEDGGIHLKDSAGTVTDFPAGGGSGIAATIFDAKGDIIAATAADTASRLAVGATNGLALVVASGEATGLKYGYIRHVGAKVYKTAQTVTDDFLAFDAELWDSDTLHDNSTNNSRLTVPITGKYHVTASSFVSVTNARLEVWVNGVIARGRGSSPSYNNYAVASADLDLAATDYVQIKGVSGGSATYGDAGNNGDNTVFSIHLIGV